MVAVLSLGDADAAKDPYKKLTQKERMDAIRHAQVWTQTDVPSIDIKAGPQDVKAFAPEEVVACDWVPKKVSSTPKFYCAIDPKDKDQVKVKYGEKNGEVYAEVAATRLLWALGFGADRMYPVKVNCRGCSADPINDQKKYPGERLFDPAAVERLMPGQEMETDGKSGWNWVELSNVDQTNGGAPLAQRDALRLLAVFMQHTDSKAEQQRLICLDKPMGEKSGSEQCEHPFMMLNDVGKTFGKANMFNKDEPGAVNLKAWSGKSIWKDKSGCTGNMSKSMTGSLEDPKISEGGRKFLADLLTRLSDQQIHDLFDVARFTRRDAGTSVDDWVAAFKKKRDEITTRTCTS
jgi:hypothetical protein